MAYDPARQWERYGALDPYYGVLSEPGFHPRAPRRSRPGALLSDRPPPRRRDVDGNRVVCRQRLHSHAGRALDFGCGVGRVTLPLAERCERVYGVDVSSSMLREAARNAAGWGCTTWSGYRPSGSSRLSGCYDLVHAFLVFQHIPVRAGERMFADAGAAACAAAGVGSIQVALRPSHPAAGAFHWTMKTVPLAYNLANVARGRDPGRTRTCR